MNKSVFINDFISLGMTSYFNKNNENIFESHIIECLCDIYGKEKVQKIYEAKDEAGFIELLHVYSMSRNLYDNFLRDTMKYEKFREDKKKNQAIKTDICSKLEVTVITMFLYKCLLIEPSLEDLSHFENDLLNNFSIIKMHFSSSINPNKTREVWDKKKRILSDNVELVEIKPEYLDEFTYSKYGTSLKDVKKMDYRMVEELNSYIKSKMAVEVEDSPKEPKTKIGLLKNTALSSGNGFVDALLIAGIIATEMSIGLIILFLNL